MFVHLDFSTQNEMEKEQLPKVELIPEPKESDMHNAAFDLLPLDYFEYRKSAFFIGVQWHQKRQNYLEVISILESRIAEYKKQNFATTEGLAISNELVVRLEKENRELKEKLNLHIEL